MVCANVTLIDGTLYFFHTGFLDALQTAKVIQ